MARWVIGNNLNFLVNSVEPNWTNQIISSWGYLQTFCLQSQKPWHVEPKSTTSNFYLITPFDLICKRRNRVLLDISLVSVNSFLEINLFWGEKKERMRKEKNVMGFEMLPNVNALSQLHTESAWKLKVPFQLAQRASFPCEWLWLPITEIPFLRGLG